MRLPHAVRGPGLSLEGLGEALPEGTFTRTLTMKICWKLRLLGTALDNSGEIALEHLDVGTLVKTDPWR